MRGKELEAKLREIKISNAELAKMLNVSELTVWLWIDERLSMSETVSSFIKSLNPIPSEHTIIITPKKKKLLKILFDKYNSQTEDL